MREPEKHALPWHDVAYYCREHERPVLALQYFLPGMPHDSTVAEGGNPSVKGVCAKCLQDLWHNHDP